MSFSFGFTAENFSDDELIENEFTPSVDQTASKLHSNPLDSTSNNDAQPAKFENFVEIVQSLKDVRITFEKYQTPAGNIVYRRELFDVKHQLMSEDNDEYEHSDEFAILIGSNSTDLKKNVYEGGLKSWECSIDTVDKLSTLDDETIFGGDILELGCGTALPSTYLFKRALINRSIRDKTFVLTDYNSSVLRLVTIPNLIATWASTLSDEDFVSLQRSEEEGLPIVEEELQLTQALLQRFLQTLESKNITIRLLSGAWSREFMNMLESLNIYYKFIITSETIYSPETLPVIGELLIELVVKSKAAGRHSTGIVSAKDIYFGVGGSVVEFEQFLEQRRAQGANITFRSEKINAGLKRSIVFIE